VRPIEHRCTRCEQVDVIPGDLVVACPTCMAKPGYSCTSLNQGHLGEPVGRSHPKRRAIIRDMDEARSRPRAAVIPLRSVG
jgi:hypothetical protein